MKADKTCPSHKEIVLSPLFRVATVCNYSCFPRIVKDLVLLSLPAGIFLPINDTLMTTRPQSGLNPHHAAQHWVLLPGSCWQGTEAL
uniref:Uncharacterized protein n=1 Tax=Pan troglodytes TaxID=9598 RepID=G2HJJ4_PANTR|nr:hypothetical protein [Pan troglodytes]